MGGRSLMGKEVKIRKKFLFYIRRVKDLVLFMILVRIIRFDILFFIKIE